MSGNALWADIICYILSALIVFVTLFLIFIYIKTKELHSYPCYLNITISLVISIDNILRLIPFTSGKNDDNDHKNELGCKLQGYALVLFDKLMLVTMTIYSITTTFGMVKYEQYQKYEKCSFISLTITGIILSLGTSILFMLNGAKKYGEICYVIYKEEELKVDKELIDTIVTSFLYFINFICNIYLLYHIKKVINESENENDEKKVKDYSFHFWKYFVNFWLNNLTFIMVILIIKDKFFHINEIITLSYVFLSLLIVIFYAMNLRVLKEGKKLILCKKEIKEPFQIDEDEDDEEEQIEFGELTSL